MKLWVAAMGFLLCAYIAAANAPAVEVISYQAANRNVRLALNWNGKPARDVKIAVLTEDDQLLFSLSSHDQSLVSLPSLAPGKYHVTALTKEDLRADVYLNVSARVGDKPSEFVIELTVKPPPNPSFDEQLSAAEKMPVSLSLGKFVGIVRDPSGAAIRGCHVQIFERGFRDSRHTINLTSDEKGWFSVLLAEGSYTAVFLFAGFRTQFLVFEILSNGSQKEVSVRLELGLTT